MGDFYSNESRIMRFTKPWVPCETRKSQLGGKCFPMRKEVPVGSRHKNSRINGHEQSLWASSDRVTNATRVGMPRLRLEAMPVNSLRSQAATFQVLPVSTRCRHDKPDDLWNE